MGSSSDTMGFYDAIDNGVFFRIKSFLGDIVPLPLSNFWRSFKGHWGLKIITFCSGIVLYYADVIKDLLLAVQFKSKVLGQSPITEEALKNNAYPLAIFFVIIASVAIAQVTKLFGTLEIFAELFFSGSEHVSHLQRRIRGETGLPEEDSRHYFDPSDARNSLLP